MLWKYKYAKDTFQNKMKFWKVPRKREVTDMRVRKMTKQYRAH